MTEPHWEEVVAARDLTIVRRPEWLPGRPGRVLRREACQEAVEAATAEQGQKPIAEVLLLLAEGEGQTLGSPEQMKTEVAGVQRVALLSTRASET